MVLYCPKTPEIDGELRTRISNDRRVRLKLDWISEPKELVLAASGDGVLLLDGSALHHKTEVKSALASASGVQEKGRHPACFLDAGALDALLEQLGDFSPSQLLAQAREKSSARQPGPSGRGERMLVYLPASEGSAISREEDFQVQHERLLKTGGGLENDSFLTRTLSRPVSRRMTRFFIGTSITPNQITIMSFLLGLGSAWSFLQGGYWMGLAGGGLLLLSIWVDGVDGEVARLKFMETRIGGKLDIVCDNIVHVVLFFSIGMGLYFATDQEIYKLLGGLAALGSLLSFILMGTSVIQSKSEAGADKNAKRQEKSLADKFANRDFTYFLVAMALIDRIDIFIWFTAVGANVFTLYLLYCKLRPSSQSH